MADKPSPKSDATRALREAKFAASQKARPTSATGTKPKPKEKRTDG